MFRNMYNQYNFYEILEISPRATGGVIEAAYKTLVKKYHPDLNAGISDHKIKLLNMAREVLMDAAKRDEYDAVYKVYHSKGRLSSGIENPGVLKFENERLKKEIEELNKRLEMKAKYEDNNVFVICTGCGAKNRLPNMSFLNLQGIKCGVCKVPFGTGNRDFEEEKNQKEKASLLKKNADIEWRRLDGNLSRTEYARIDSLFNKYKEIQETYPRVYGIKTKLKALKDELMLRNSNVAVMKKIAEECSAELARYNSKGILGFFKNEKVLDAVRERINKETAMYPGLREEKIVYGCPDCGVKNAIKVEMFVSNYDNILCGSCHCNLFR